MLFGEFLIMKGVISEAVLAQALEQQKKQALPLGTLALQKGWIDNKSLYRILAEQKKPENGSAADIASVAVKLGLLTQSQIDQLGKEKKTSHVLLGEVLVESKTISSKQLLTLLREFHNENK